MSGNGLERLRVSVGVSMSYYDGILVGIAALLMVGILVGIATPVGLHGGLAGGSVGATLLVYHTLFRNPPVVERSDGYKTGFVVWHLYLLGLLVTLL